MRALTIVDFFTRSAERYPENLAVRVPALRRPGYEELSYRELRERARRLAAALRQRGISQGDHVVLFSPPRVEWVVAFLGVLHAGGVVIPIDAQLSAAEAQRIVAQADAKLALVATERHRALRETGLELIALGEGKGRNVETLEEVIASTPEGFSATPDPEDLAVIAFTSGTTGSAKGVMLSHRNFSADVEACLERMPVGPEDVLLSIAPWYHSYGLTAGLLVALYAGATAVYTSDYKELPRIMQETGTTVLLGVPKLYHLMYERIINEVRKNPLGKALLWLAPKLVGQKVKRKLATPRLRFFVSGGAPLDPEVARGFRRLGIGMIEGYGLTETAPVLAFSYPFDRKAGTVGPPFSSVEVKILDPDEEGVGEILVRGPMVMRGYYKNPEKTKEVLDEEGWFHTGDLGKLDEENWLYIKGRKKNVIVLESGKNVYPEEVEFELGRSRYIEDILIKRGYRQGKEVVQALVYPDWERLKREGIASERLTEGEIAKVKELLWREISTRGRNLAPYKRVKSREDIMVLSEPFEKTNSQDIKRYLYLEEGSRVGG